MITSLIIKTWDRCGHLEVNHFLYSFLEALEIWKPFSPDNKIIHFNHFKNLQAIAASEFNFFFFRTKLNQFHSKEFSYPNSFFFFFFLAYFPIIYYILYLRVNIIICVDPGAYKKIIR